MSQHYKVCMSHYINFDFKAAPLGIFIIKFAILEFDILSLCMTHSQMLGKVEYGLPAKI